MEKKKSLKQRLADKKRKLKEKKGKSFVLRQKEEGTVRVRVLPTGEDNDFVFEVIGFWLGKDLGLVYSPQTFGEPCALYESYLELKDSDDDDDKELAKKLVPKSKYLVPFLWYLDLKGKKVDESSVGKLTQIAQSAYQELIDLYLDEDDWGDMTDPKNGYDVKMTREGTGFTDTKYSIAPAKNTKLPKKYAKPVDLEKMVRGVIASYEETIEKRDAFLGISSDEPRRKKKKKKKPIRSAGKTSKKKKRRKIKDDDLPF